MCKVIEVKHSHEIVLAIVYGHDADFTNHNPRRCKYAKSKNYLPPASHGETPEAASPHSVREDSRRAGWKKLKRYMNFQKRDSEGGQKSSCNEISDMYLISMLVSINIAVFLFEIASPIRHSDVELFSLPSLYGAKINHLILLGEWWRLVTPMFLHSGILHIAFGCWVLLTFGPRVCRAYGSFTFLLIYILGGISGNLTSYLQTPEPTVGGTGPVFALIGAWLIYQIQNKNVIARDNSEDMFQKAVIATACSFVLGNFGPIDDWTHFGALFTGMIYGFLACPILQMGDRSSESGQDERITLFGQYADPCKSVMIFSICVLVLSSLLFIIEPPLNSLPVGSLL
ncbi:RHOMBOID-like protein 9, chloroplastic isoform X2 [Diospyros lotus]|uniref:RHOMBOID-like protein 9, chloroplastic isoform X2 n=1 Tax=Diospyros lotus TaxID=55363 RepID=UPI00224E7290|nr:RHOMBOID-like protein 9, chloroplastic isoform X2 [Diospyros lotus]